MRLTPVTGVFWDERGAAIVEVDAAADRSSLRKWAWAPFPSGAAESRSESIRRLFDEHGFSRDRVVVGLPQREILLKTAVLPRASRSDTEKMALLQAQKRAPGLEGGVEFDFDIRGGRGPGQRVACVLARRSAVNEVLSLLSDAGVSPERIVPESHALLALAPKPLRNGDFCLIHSDGDRALIIFVSKGSIVLAHACDPAGPEWDRSPAYVRLAAVWSDMKEDSDITSPHPQTLLLTGDEKGRRALRDRLGRESGGGVEILEQGPVPFGGAAGDGGGCSRLLASFGAALLDGAKVNLMPGPVKRRREGLRRRREWTAIAVAGLIFAFSLGIMAVQRISEVKNRIAVLDRRLSSLGPKIREAKAMLETFRLREGGRASGMTLSEALHRLSDGLPARVRMESLGFEAGKGMSIQATARSVSEAAEWARRLAGSGGFYRAELGATSSRAVAGQGVVDFSLEVEFPPRDGQGSPRG